MNFSFSLNAKRSLSFSLDACYTGFYFWCGSFTVRVGGVAIEENQYPYVVPTLIGFGFVLPNYFSWHTPFSEYRKITKNEANGLKPFAKGVGI